MVDKITQLSKEVEKLVNKNNRLTTRIIELSDKTTVLTQSIYELTKEIEAERTEWNVSKNGKYFHIRTTTGRLVASLRSFKTANLFADAWNNDEKLDRFSLVMEREQQIIKVANTEGVFIAKFYNKTDVEMLFLNKILML